MRVLSSDNGTAVPDDAGGGFQRHLAAPVHPYNYQDGRGRLKISFITHVPNGAHRRIHLSGDRVKPVFLLPLALLMASAIVPSHASQQLAQSNACLACHAPDKKLVGPSYRDVAKKYASQPDAASKLAASIRKGGSGTWGPVPMPAQPNLSEADALKLAQWVLDGAK
jgi:cytochrome c